MGQAQDMYAALGSGVPSGWSPRSAYGVELTVAQDGGGDPTFSYTHPLFDEPAEALDLRVGEDCMILLDTDASNGLSWSLAADAVTLKKSADARYYFGLKYLDRGVAYDRADFPAGRKCSQVCFGARLNVDAPENDRHAFSLNVELEMDGQVIPIIIDPDIKNPSA
jgi:hypothetical protein